MTIEEATSALLPLALRVCTITLGTVLVQVVSGNASTSVLSTESAAAAVVGSKHAKRGVEDNEEASTKSCRRFPNRKVSGGQAAAEIVFGCRQDEKDEVPEANVENEEERDDEEEEEPEDDDSNSPFAGDRTLLDALRARSESKKDLDGAA
jgi:hypothetical protein